MRLLQMLLVLQQLLLLPLLHSASAASVDSAALATATAVATEHIKTMRSARPEDQLLLNALKNHGASTERQLQALFEKCTTPSSRIVIGVLGGSISAFPNISYQYPLQRFLKRLCPQAKVDLHNGARAAHGSLTVGMCARAGLGQHVDLLILEFTLNDLSHYHRFKQTECPAYELAVRTGLTSFQHAPALLGLYFWGPYFTYDSAQPYHEKICRHYGITGLSMRDLVWPYIAAKRKPWAERTDVCLDGHHPTFAMHVFTANLLGLYMSEIFLEWAAQQQQLRPQQQGANATATNVTATSRRRASVALPPWQLPTPLSSELSRLDLTQGKLHCRWSIEPAFGNLSNHLTVHESEGWSVGDKPPCTHFLHSNASALLPVETRQGVVIMSNCFRPPGLWEVDPAFKVYLLHRANDTQVDGGSDVPVFQTLLIMRPLVNGSGESFMAEPPLPPGRHMLQVTPNPHCLPDAQGQCGGFYAVVTL